MMPRCGTRAQDDKELATTTHLPPEREGGKADAEVASQHTA